MMRDWGRNRGYEDESADVMGNIGKVSPFLSLSLNLSLSISLSLSLSLSPASATD